MPTITDGGAIFVSSVLTITCIVCAAAYGPRLRWEDHHEVWGVLVRLGIVLLVIL